MKENTISQTSKIQFVRKDLPKSLTSKSFSVGKGIGCAVLGSCLCSLARRSSNPLGKGPKSGRTKVATEEACSLGGRVLSISAAVYHKRQYLMQDLSSQKPWPTIGPYSSTRAHDFLLVLLQIHNRSSAETQDSQSGKNRWSIDFVHSEGSDINRAGVHFEFGPSHLMKGKYEYTKGGKEVYS